MAADRWLLCDEISIRDTRQNTCAQQTAGTPSAALSAGRCRGQADPLSVAKQALAAKRGYEVAPYEGIHRSL